MTTSLTVGAIAITTDGSSAYELMAWDPGPSPVENMISESKHLPGGVLISTRVKTTVASLTVYVTGSDLDDAYTKVIALQDELNPGAMFDLVEEFDSTTLTYDCFPATTHIPRDPILMEENILLLTATIERNPTVVAT
jgi:hypothetical protein